MPSLSSSSLSLSPGSRRLNSSQCAMAAACCDSPCSPEPVKHLVLSLGPSLGMTMQWRVGCLCRTADAFRTTVYILGESPGRMLRCAARSFRLDAVPVRRGRAGGSASALPAPACSMRGRCTRAHRRARAVRRQLRRPRAPWRWSLASLGAPLRVARQVPAMQRQRVRRERAVQRPPPAPAALGGSSRSVALLALAMCACSRWRATPATCARSW
jgi:hypothetical protein